MSLIPRKPRPLARDPETLRDTCLFIVACDDRYAPKQYFDFLQLSRVQVHVIPTMDCTSAAQHVLERLLSYQHAEDDQLWLVLDTDHYTQGTHLRSVLSAIRDARRKGVHVALSKPCFELWLLLHHVDEAEVTDLAEASEVEAALRKTLGEYNKTHLKREHYPLNLIFAASERAERLDAGVSGGEIPATNTTRVYRLMKAIAAKVLPAQLPAELSGLTP